ncbi:MAG: hypothetical protein ACOZQL_04595 [Myxococcota bacterium]
MAGGDASHPPGSSMSVSARVAFALLPAAALAAVLWLLATFELPLQATWPWVPALGVELAFRVDSLAALLLLMITGVGTAVFVYAGGYLASGLRSRRLPLRVGSDRRLRARADLWR